MSDPIFADDVTAQQLFDRVWTRFVIEKAPRSVVPGGNMCLYRRADGAACAVGILATDDECVGWEAEGPVHAIENLPPRLVPHLDLLGDLQYAHDGSDGDLVGANRLLAVAIKHGLTIPEVPHA
jgi:hypothetical protein